jgi:hypothetical protein
LSLCHQALHIYTLNQIQLTHRSCAWALALTLVYLAMCYKKHAATALFAALLPLLGTACGSPLTRRISRPDTLVSPSLPWAGLTVSCAARFKLVHGSCCCRPHRAGMGGLQCVDG